jgi:hypothetical protein
VLIVIIIITNLVYLVRSSSRTVSFIVLDELTT